jgi:hypothetical protein
VPAALGNLGVNRVFHKVAQRPGKPLFGTDRRLAFSRCQATPSRYSPAWRATCCRPWRSCPAVPREVGPCGSRPHTGSRRRWPCCCPSPWSTIRTAAPGPGPTRPRDQATSTRWPGEPTTTPYSHVSGGGGERDRHHAHDAEGKRDTQENSAQRAKP